MNLSVFFLESIDILGLFSGLNVFVVIRFFFRFKYGFVVMIKKIGRFVIF